MPVPQLAAAGAHGDADVAGPFGVAFRVAPARRGSAPAWGSMAVVMGVIVRPAADWCRDRDRQSS